MININEEVARLRAKSEALTKSHLLQAQRLADRAGRDGTRMRPYTLDYLERIFAPDFQELHGDRMYADDPAIIGGRGPHRRTRGDVHRSPEGAGHQGEGAAQLRHAQAGRLPQGAAADAARREVLATGT